MFTPENIDSLESGQVFVFGSNALGHHMGGAALIAWKKFGAEWYVGEGLTGQSYAFPTLDGDMQKRSMEDLEKSRDRLFMCAGSHPELTFFVTRIGTGIAGYTNEETSQLFDKNTPKNIILPRDWDVRYE